MSLLKCSLTALACSQAAQLQHYGPFCAAAVLLPFQFPQSHLLPVVLRKGGWQDVTIPLDRFLQTHKGRLVETRSEMNIHRILSLGISTASLGDTKQDGPFSLGIQSIKATQHKYSPVEN